MAGTFRALDENHSLFTLLRQEPCWWQFLKKDKDLYIAVRKDNYLNVYYQDGCMAKIFMHDDGTLMAICHRKYLSGISAKEYGNDYLDITKSLTESTIRTVDKIKSNIKTFYKNECVETKETGISEKYIQWEWAKGHQKDILDLELAFYKGKKKVRVDIVQLSYGEIILTELKRINDGRMLKKGQDIEPEIISQMAFYRSFIAEHAEELLLFYYY